MTYSAVFLPLSLVTPKSLTNWDWAAAGCPRELSVPRGKVLSSHPLLLRPCPDRSVRALKFERHRPRDQWGRVGAAEASGVCGQQHLVQTTELPDGKGRRFMGACGEAPWAGGVSIPYRASVQRRATSYCSPRYGVVSPLLDSVFGNFKTLIKSKLSNFFLLLLVLLMSHLRTRWKFQCHEGLALCFLLRA